MNCKRKEVEKKVLQLRKYREAAGLTMRETARRLSISSPAYSNWENGKAMPTADKLPATAELFGVSIDELYGRGAGRMPPHDASISAEGGERHEV